MQYYVKLIVSLCSLAKSWIVIEDRHWSQYQQPLVELPPRCKKFMRARLRGEYEACYHKSSTLRTTASPRRASCLAPAPIWTTLCRSKRHGKSLGKCWLVLGLSLEDFVLHTCGFHLFITYKKRSSAPFPNAHPLTERSQDPVVLLFLPDVQKRLAVLLFKIVVFRKTNMNFC